MTRLNSNRVNEMPKPDGRLRSCSDLRAGGTTDHRDGQRYFLRYSHIFSSIVREVLEQKYLREVSPFTLTLLQFHLLKVIALNGGLQVGEVASVLGVSPPGTTKNIDKLERLGLIVRGRCKGDRRATLLSPSRKGYRLVRKYEGLKADRLGPVLEEFSEEDITQLTRLLERFSLSLAKRENSDAALCLWCAGYCEAGCAVAEIRGGCPYAKVRTGRGGDEARIRRKARHDFLGSGR